MSVATPNGSGKALREIRAAAGLSLGQLVKLSDYSKGHLSKVENGLRPASLHLVQLYESLGTRPIGIPALRAAPAMAPRPIPAATVLSYGGEIRRARAEHDLSLRELAAMSGVSHTYLWKIETGQSLGTDYVASRLDKALGRDGYLIGLYQREAHSTSEKLAIPSPSILSAAVPCHPRECVGPASAAARLETLRTQRHLYGWRAVLPDVITHLVALQSCASEAPRGLVGPIRNVEARYAEYLSWLAEEMSDMVGMRHWMAAAVQLGREGGDRHVAQYAALRRSAAALRAGDPAAAAAQARQVLSDPALPPRLRRISLQRESRAHAMCGDRAAFRRAMDMCRGLTDQARPAPADGWEWGPPSDPLVASSRLDEATGLMELGDYRAVAELFAASMPHAFPDGHSLSPLARNTRVRFAIREAATYAHVHECDLAADVIESFLPAMAPAWSTVVRQDLRRLASILARRRHARLRALAPDIVTLARTKQPSVHARRLESRHA